MVSVKNNRNCNPDLNSTLYVQKVKQLSNHLFYNEPDVWQ